MYDVLLRGAGGEARISCPYRCKKSCVCYLGYEPTWALKRRPVEMRYSRTRTRTQEHSRNGADRMDADMFWTFSAPTHTHARARARTREHTHAHARTHKPGERVSGGCGDAAAPPALSSPRTATPAPPTEVSPDHTQTRAPSRLSPTGGHGRQIDARFWASPKKHELYKKCSQPMSVSGRAPLS